MSGPAFDSLFAEPGVDDRQAERLRQLQSARAEAVRWVLGQAQPSGADPERCLPIVTLATVVHALAPHDSPSKALLECRFAVEAMRQHIELSKAGASSAADLLSITIDHLHRAEIMARVNVLHPLPLAWSMRV